MTSVPHVVRRAVAMVATAAAGLAACSLSLVSGERPVLTIGAAGAVAVVGAVVTGWRWLGSIASFVVTATVLFAAVVSSEQVGAWHLAGGVGASRRPGRRAGPGGATCPVPPSRADRARPDGPSRPGPGPGLVAAAGVALAADRPAVPSVGLVLLGLAAGVAALVIATSPS